MHVWLENQECFLHEFTGLGSPIHNCFIPCQKALETWENLMEKRKCLLTRNRFSIKSCFHLGLTASTISLTPTVKLGLFLVHMHTLTVKLKGCTDAVQRNGGKHATSDPLVRVTARPAEASERRNIMKMIRSDSLLPPQTGSQVDNCFKLPATVRRTLSPAFKHTVGAGWD